MAEIFKENTAGCGVPATVEDIPWDAGVPPEQTQINSTSLPGMKGELNEWKNPLANLPPALIGEGGGSVSEGLSAWQKKLDAITAEYRSVRGPDSAADVVAGLRDQAPELPDPVEPDRPPEFDWKKFQVTAVVYSRPRKRSAHADAVLREKVGGDFGKFLRTLPNKNTVLYGWTRSDDAEFPAFVHTTSELAAWIGGGEGLGQIQHSKISEHAGSLATRAAGSARRRKKIDVAE